MGWPSTLASFLQALRTQVARHRLLASRPNEGSGQRRFRAGLTLTNLVDLGPDGRQSHARISVSVCWMSVAAAFASSTLGRVVWPPRSSLPVPGPYPWVDAAGHRGPGGFKSETEPGPRFGLRVDDAGQRSRAWARFEGSMSGPDGASGASRCAAGRRRPGAARVASRVGQVSRGTFDGDCCERAGPADGLPERCPVFRARLLGGR